MKLTYAKYDETMDYLEKIYDEYVKLTTEELINEGLSHVRNDCCSSIEWGMEDYKVMYSFNDFATTVYCGYDGSLTVSQVIDVSIDGLGLVGYLTDKTGEIDFEIKVEKMN
ncbi:hypothetical protein ACLHWY_17655 [Priestia aryabhattai]|uniref:hypothetical protein n=1 Tax=Priestia aryabhattai TaxID=412384 RepID=UPI003982D8A9